MGLFSFNLIFWHLCYWCTNCAVMFENLSKFRSVCDFTGKLNTLGWYSSSHIGVQKKKTNMTKILTFRTSQPKKLLGVTYFTELTADNFCA